MTRARSLSRLANSNAFTVDANNRVGIGSTQPDVRLDVNGDMNVTGTLTYEDVTNVETAGITTTGGLIVTGLGATIGGITTFFGDLNFGAAGVGGTITTLGHAEFAGVVTATSFSGDGSGLTGVASTDNINTSTLAQFTGGVGIADSIFHIGDSNTAIRFPAGDTFTVQTAGNERFRIESDGGTTASDNLTLDEDGRLLLGTTTARTDFFSGTLSADVQIEGSSFSAYSCYATNGNGAFIFGRDNGSDGSTIGNLSWQADDGTDEVEAARISGQIDGTPGSNDMPGRLVFFTTADGASSTTERLRIDSSGRVIIGTNSGSANITLKLQGHSGDSTQDAKIRLCRGSDSPSDTNQLGAIFFSDNSESPSADIIAIRDGGTWSGSSKPGALKFATTADGATSATERLRITSDGIIRIPDNGKLTCGAGDDLQIYHDGSNSYIDDTGTGRLNIRGNTGVSLRNYSDSEQFINCYTNGTVELFYDNSKKFETTPGGTITAGINTSGGFRATGNNTPSSGQGLEMFCPDTSSSQIQSFDRTNGETDKLILRGNPIELKDSSNTVRLEVNPAGVNITGIATATSLFEGSSRVATAGKAVAMALVFG